jgi:aspartate/methionine/tyrosine aminotransferase
MTALPDFRLETHFSKWEFTARYNLAASDAESMTLRELLTMGDPSDMEDLMELGLDYTPTWGAPDLRAAIAGTYANRDASDVLCFAGAEEGIYAVSTTLLDPGDHAITVLPCYQSLESVAGSICEVTGVPLDADDGWTLDIDRVAASIRPNTRLIAINFPHNPTGAILPPDRLHALIGLCRKHGIHLFSDEVYRLLGHDRSVHLPPVADLYEKGISLGVLSKAYGLAGLRIGWVASADRELLHRLERMKHYLSICNAGPSEHLALVALKARDRILARNQDIVTANLETLRRFFEERPDLFDWSVPDGGCTAFPRYLGPDGVDHFTDSLVQEAGVLLLPGTVYSAAPGAVHHDRFRIGFGRRNLDEGLAAFRAHIAAHYPLP